MAWIYLAESVESPWLWLHGSDRSPTVKVIDSLRLFYCHGCETGQFHPPRFGTMSRLYTKACCPEGLTSSMEDSPVRTSALLEMERAWKEREADYSSKSYGSLARFDRDSFSWKTSQLSLFGGLTAFSWNSLRWGMIVDGLLFQPLNLEPRTFVKDGGYLPTPTATDWKRSYYKQPGGWKTYSLPTLAKMGKLPGHPPGLINPEWIEQAMGYPTGSTDLSDLETQWFRKQHAKRSSDC